jgi:3-methyl-2-oxobutanoate hydroxymethyltransferase
MSKQQAPITLTRLRQMKAAGEKFACLTAYDASFSRILDECGVDVILVGDSLGMVIQGQDTTVPVTMNDMIYHSRAVARGCHHALLMVDMPFMASATVEQAFTNAARLMQEGGAQIIKLEGSGMQLELVRELALRGIPVCAHLGLQPQIVHKLGGYKVQGREAAAAQAMIESAVALEQVGADMLLLECVPAALASQITQAVSVPVIGIGAGVNCDGQVLVLYDVLGISPKTPRFAQNFLESGTVRSAVTAFVEAVRAGKFPDRAHTFE